MKATWRGLASPARCVVCVRRSGATLWPIWTASKGVVGLWRSLLLAPYSGSLGEGPASAAVCVSSWPRERVSESRTAFANVTGFMFCYYLLLSEEMNGFSVLRNTCLRLHAEGFDCRTHEGAE